MVAMGNKRERDARWVSWFGDIEFNDATLQIVEKIDDDTIGGLKDRQSNIEFYIIVYYRLHAFLEDRSFSDAIDTVVFGGPLRARGFEVFSKVEEQPEPRILDSQRAEVLIFAPAVNKYLSMLGEFRELTESILSDPGSQVAASMLQARIDDFKGQSVGSTEDLLVEMQKYLGHYMNTSMLLFDGLQMLSNERVYGFNSKESMRFGRGQLSFDNEVEFQSYLKCQLEEGLKHLNGLIAFAQNSFHERPDLMLLKSQHKEEVAEMILWSRKIARDSRGDESLFERI